MCENMRFLAMVLVVAVSCGVARAERIVLKNGHEIHGPVLKQDDKAVVVDLGNTVIRLDRAEVAEIIADATEQNADAADAADEAAESEGPMWQLYRRAEMKIGTIEAKAKKFGQSVVMVTTPGGMGSGFMISPDGYLITNYHVIDRETRIKITVFAKGDQGFEQKHYKKVRIIAINPFVDLALLKIDEAETPFHYAYLGKIEDVKVGQEVFAIGNPLGLTRTVSQGIVSTKNRSFSGQLYIQTTTDINPGNSGGPLFNLRGEVIGVTSMGYLFFGGLNFAIPVDVVKRFIENRDAFAYDEDNPNAGHRYLQPSKRIKAENPPRGKVPTLDAGRPEQADGD